MTGLLQNSRRRVHNWLRGEAPVRGAPLYDDSSTDPATTTATTSTEEALQLLSKRWRKIWDRNVPDMWKDKMRVWTKRLPQQDWTDHCYLDVRGAMDRQRGTAARVDGWSGTEVADLGIVAPAVAVVFDAFEMAEALPSSWSEARRVQCQTGRGQKPNRQQSD